MNPMSNKTPEERRAIAAKGFETRRKNRLANEAARQEAIKYAGGLREQIDSLEKKLASLQRLEKLNAVSATIHEMALLRENEIARYSLPWKKSSGVYFLLEGNEIVYVGQSTHVYSRIAQHNDKTFDRYAFIPCPPDKLDRLESLYIHYLRPRLNGNTSNGGKLAQLSFAELIGLV